MAHLRKAGQSIGKLEIGQMMKWSLVRHNGTIPLIYFAIETIRISHSSKISLCTAEIQKKLIIDANYLNFERVALEDSAMLLNL